MDATILLVDDHDRVRESFRDWLHAMLPGCQFLEAKDGEEGVDLASAHRPDVVLMDIRIGEENGIDAARRIKAVLPETHVVMLTIHDARDYREDAKNAGAAAYVLKQEAHSALLPVLKRLLMPSEEDTSKVV